MFAEEVLIEIDTTLDQLIRNAELIQDVELQELSEMEVTGFQKTQESLLQHLLHLDQFFETRKSDQSASHKKSGRYQIQEKLLKFEKLKREYKKKEKIGSELRWGGVARAKPLSRDPSSGVTPN